MQSKADDILIALQRGLPLEVRPFAALARELGREETELFDFLRNCRSDGLVRRFGAVFDTRRLGYSSALCCAKIPDRDVDRVAAKLVAYGSITHCYLRCPVNVDSPSCPNLWFTVSCPHDAFEATVASVAGTVAPYAMRVLPALRRYKIDVIFGAATRAAEESVEDIPPPTEEDKRIIGALQGDTECVSDYFGEIAGMSGCGSRERLLDILRGWKANGRLKRIGLLLAHREAGWLSNGMCCWKIAGATLDAGRRLASCDEISHCYERAPFDGFDYNLYGMVHAHTIEEAVSRFDSVSERCGLKGGIMLVSTREYKKTSMTFFSCNSSKLC